MRVYESEQAQVEALKDWWKKNGKAAIAVLILAIALSFGWRYWQQQQLQKTEQASIMYEQMLSSSLAQPTADISEFATRLEQHYQHTPYASLAALLEARQAVDAGKLDLAEQKLRWVIDHASSKGIKQIARLRAARILIAQNQYQPALDLLNHVDDNAYLAGVNMVKGDAYAGMGDKQQARQAYQTTLTMLPADAAVKPFVQMKLAQLAP